MKNKYIILSLVIGIASAIIWSVVFVNILKSYSGIAVGICFGASFGLCFNLIFKKNKK